MRSETPVQTYNFSNPTIKGRFIERTRMLNGAWDIQMEPHRPRRSNQANRYYWGVVMPYLARMLSETSGEYFDSEASHQWAKRRFLSKPIINKNTGEDMDVKVGRTPKMNSPEFTEYIEKICGLCADNGVVVPLPDYERTGAL
jgi:hypothetical protein